MIKEPYAESLRGLVEGSGSGAERRQGFVGFHTLLLVLLHLPADGREGFKRSLRGCFKSGKMGA